MTGFLGLRDYEAHHCPLMRLNQGLRGCGRWGAPLDSHEITWKMVVSPFQFIQNWLAGSKASMQVCEIAD